MRYNLQSEREFELKVRLVGEEVNHWFSVETLDINRNPDCKVGHFGLNFWFRTDKAMNYEAYDKLGQMLGDIAQEASQRDLSLVEYRIQRNWVFNKDLDDDKRDEIVEEGVYNVCST